MKGCPLTEKSSSEKNLKCVVHHTNYHHSRLFEYYKSQVHNFTPILSDPNKFEKQVCAFIDQRSVVRKPEHTFNKSSIAWLSLLYAVLASGSHFKDISHVERASQSNGYLRYSFQCLRFTDFLFDPTIECLETLLLLGNVLQNLMKPQAAWILLGTTSRIAQSLGIHRKHIAEGQLSRDNRLWFGFLYNISLNLSF